MSSLLELLSGSIDSRALGQLGAQIGATPQQTGAAVQAALPALLGALQRNAASPTGASALAGALDRNHDGSVLDDVVGFFSKPATGSDLRSLGHIFGDRHDAVAGAVSRASGLDGSQVTQLLAQLAPLILGALARVRQNAPASAGASPGGGLGDLLGTAMGQLQGSGSGLGGLLGGLLGSSGGGGAGGGLGDLLGGLLGDKRR